jgi:signal transduction histidine kinase
MNGVPNRHEPTARSAPSRRKSSRVLVICFAAVILCFGVSLFYTEVTLRRVDAGLENIASTSMPSIEHLTAARAHLRDSERMLEEAADGHPWGRGALQHALSGIDTEWSAYLRLSGATEAEHDRATLSLEQLRRTINVVRDHLLAGDLANASPLVEHDLRLAANATDDALGTLVQFHAAEGRRAVERADATRQRAAVTAFRIDGVSVLVSVVLGVVAVAAMRRYANAVEARADELEQFATRVAHDIRGPLTPAMFALQRVHKVTSDEGMCKLAARGTRGLRVVESIVDGLLGFAQSGARPCAGAATSVRSAVEDALSELRPLANDHAITLRVEPFVDCSVACAAGVLASILSNLVRNAIKYMGAGPERRITLRVREGLSCRLEVEDTGPGLPLGMEEKVFEAYVRGPTDGIAGLGLGLATVKRLADAHGGAVGVQSREGRGSTFWIELPKAASNARHGSPTLPTHAS